MKRKIQKFALLVLGTIASCTTFLSCANDETTKSDINIAKREISENYSYKLISEDRILNVGLAKKVTFIAISSLILIHRQIK